MKNYYKVLGVSRTATQEEIKKTYRKLAAQYHPDANVDKTKEEQQEREEIFKKLNEAYEILGNEAKRKEYDLELDRYYERKKSNTSSSNTSSNNNQQQSHRGYTYRNTDDYANYTYSRHNSRRYRHNKRKFEEFKRNVEKVYDDIRKCYKEVKKEEAKYSFRDRHRDIDNNFYEKYYQETDNMGLEIIYQLGRGGLHVFGEMFIQLEKLRKQKKDTTIKYVLRNRATVYATIGTLIAFNLFGGGGEIPTPKPDEGSSSETTTEIGADENIDVSEYDRVYTLNRYYTVEAGDTLSQIAYDAGVSQSTIKEINDLESSGLIIGQHLKIPYKVLSDELKYYTYAEPYDHNVSLEEFAERYNTDIKTLYSLNEEAIIHENGVYCVISDYINVPKFITQKQLQEKMDGSTYS